MSDQMQISIIVCTRNRTEKLFAAMASIADSAAGVDVTWELFIMENQSIGGPRETVLPVDRSRIPHLRYRYLEGGGKATAINAALAEAKGEIIALLDDDIVVEPDWMGNLLKEFADDPSLVCLGGRVTLYDQDDAPTTIRPSEERAIISLKTLDPKFIPVLGCNLAFRRSVLAQVGQVDGNFGPGSPIGSGDDLDYLYRICEAGLTVLFCPTVVVNHNHGRRGTDTLRKLSYGYALGRGAFYAKHIFRLRRYPLKWAMVEMLNVVISILRRTEVSSTQLSPAKHGQALIHGALRWIKLQIVG